jgi:predicted CXXCH cytochrome family protein
MKKILLIGTFALVAQLGFGQIAGTSHDFTAAAWNTTGEICIVCHTPHNAQVIANAPLWNHETSVAAYTTYNTPTFDGIATITQPSASSKLCLSCHDGTVALENFGTTTTGTNYIPANANFGTDLGNDHPISFDYDAAQALDAGIYVSTTASGIAGGTDIASDMLFGGFMECASCHDVHGTGFNFLLLKSNAGSALCLTCHDK